MKKKLGLILLCFTMLASVFALASCTDKKKDDASGKNYYVTYNGQKVEVGADAKKLIKKLGDYTSVDGEACGTDEKDVIYTLSGLEIETHVNKDGETVRKIKILNDSQKTEKGITIGATRDEVIKAYGNDYTESASGTLKYEGDTSVIEFYFGTAGSVSNIYIKRK